MRGEWHDKRLVRDSQAQNIRGEQLAPRSYLSTPILPPTGVRVGVRSAQTPDAAAWEIVASTAAATRAATMTAQLTGDSASSGDLQKRAEYQGGGKGGRQGTY